jgi:hypothetical protein
LQDFMRKACLVFFVLDPRRSGGVGVPLHCVGLREADPLPLQSVGPFFGHAFGLIFDLRGLSNPFVGASWNSPLSPTLHTN